MGIEGVKLLKMVGVRQVCMSMVVLLTILGRADAGHVDPVLSWTLGIIGGLVLFCGVACLCMIECKDCEDEWEIENQEEREGGREEEGKKQVNKEDSLLPSSYEEYCEGESVPLSEYLTVQGRLERLEQQMN